MLQGFSEGMADIDLSAEGALQKIIDLADVKTEGVLNKNAELVGKMAKYKTFETEGLAAAEKLAVLEASIEQSDLAKQGNYNDALQIAKDGFAKKLEEKDLKLGVFEKEKTKHLIDTAISKLLDDININPLYKDVVSDSFKGKSSLVDGKAMIDDKSLSDAIVEWSETEKGKASRLAPDNTGGNANGGSSNNGSSTKDYSKMTIAEKVAYLEHK